MKKIFHLVSLLALLLASAVSTAWAAQRTLTADGNGGYYINMPATGVDTLVIPDGVTTFKVYDDGGKNGQFSSRCDGYLVMRGPEGYFLRIAGNVYGKNSSGYAVGALRAWKYVPVDGNGDILFEHNETGSFGLMTGNVVVPNRLSDDREMMLRFWHYNTSRGISGGMELTVTLVDPNSIWGVSIDDNYGGEVYSDKLEAHAGDVVSLTVSVWDGYYLDYIRVVDERYQDVEVTGGTWLTNGEATFTMPNAGVEVKAFYGRTSDGPAVFVREDAAVDFNVPSGISGLKVVGFDADEEKTSAPFVLTVCEGCLVKISSSNLTDAQFVAYNGTVSDLSSAGEPDFDGVSTGRTVTLFFTYIPGRWPDPLSIEIIDMNEKHEIIVQSSSSGMGDLKPVGSDEMMASVGTRVKLVAHPDDGYMFSGAIARYSGDYNWADLELEIKDDSIWFTMPFAEVRIIPDFAFIDNPYFLVPLKGVATKEITEEQGFSEINICDDGGCNGNYERYFGNGDGTLVLTAPEGYLLYVYGIVSMSNQDYLTIYDGADTNANVLVNISGYNGIESMNSSTRSLTFRFQSSGYDEGFNVTVGLINVSGKHSITLNPYFTGGTVSIDKETAAMGDTVTLTVNPDEGYLLEDVWIRDDDYNSLKVMGGMWYSGNEAKFVMPMSDVSVYVSFNTPEEGEFGIQIPQKDTLRLTLPEKMSWVYVFVEADEQGNYYDNSDGVLELTASEGLILDVNGNNQAADEGDFLAIYDGIGEGAESIQIPAEGIFEKASTGNSLTFRFKSDESGNGRGPDLYVSVLKTMPEPSAIMIYEFADGSKSAVIDGAYSGVGVVNIDEDIKVDYVSFQREFTHGAFSTLVLPFNYNANDIWGLEQVLEFAGVGELDGKKVVKMKRVWCQENISEKCASLAGDLDANKPYMLKTLYSDIYFDGPVTLKKTTEAVTTVGDWQFRGTYSYKTWAEGDSDLGRVYGFAGSNADNINIGDFVKAGAGAWINPLRAYLIYNPNRGNAAPPAYAPVRDRVDIPEEMDVVIIDDDDNIGEKTMAIGRINTRTGVFTSNRSYDLKGRSVNSAPKAKGVYVKGRR